MQAIETVYAGYRFRSRLEARWAVFFDAMGIRWQYEPQGFEKEVDERTLRYLPDFFLPDLNTWVEVKGTEAQLSDFLQNYEFFFDFGCPLPNFTNSADGQQLRVIPNGGLLLLTDIPRVSWGHVFHPILQHRKGLVLKPATFRPYTKLEIPHPEWMAGLRQGAGLSSTPLFISEDYAPEYVPPPFIVETKQAHKPVMDAYTKARQARFEFGQTP